MGVDFKKIIVISQIGRIVQIHILVGKNASQPTVLGYKRGYEVPWLKHV
jgi:hypothetical protein